jgi:hypothetical protein
MSTPAADRRARLTSACLLVAVGLGVAVVVTLAPQHLRVPAWVVYSAAAVFVFAGLGVFARPGSRMSTFLSTLVAAGLMAPGLWIALGPGSRECTVGVPFLEGVATGAVCRAAFGAGALILAAVAVALLVRAARPRDKDS